MNQYITDEEDINGQSPMFLAKNLITAKQDKNDKLVNNINERLMI